MAADRKASQVRSTLTHDEIDEADNEPNSEENPANPPNGSTPEIDEKNFSQKVHTTK